MSKRPAATQDSPQSRYLLGQGVERIHQGKVRDTWRLNDSELMVMATDCLSIFDFVLSATVPGKGECLTALTHFWLNGVLRDYPNHLVGAGIEAFDKYLAWLPNLDMKRCLIVRDLTGQLEPYEFIFRHHIGGSVYKKYLSEKGKIFGEELPPGLPKWSKLKSPLFTPTTKAEDGHDLPIEPKEFFDKSKKAGTYLVTMLSEMYSVAYAYAEERGILILDTKFEGSSKVICAVDEILTPDSSRFADIEDWKQAMNEGREPIFFDKEVVRQWGREVATPFGVTGINNLDPENKDHSSFVHSLTVPQDVISEAAKRYQIIFERLTGKTLTVYQKEVLEI